MTRRKIKKHLLFVFVLSEIFLLNVPFTFAKFSVPSTSQVASDLESRYHINLQEAQNFGEGFNVASTKGMAPEVDIFFSPSDPKEGERITATAVPMYFTNPKESLYYTWFLRRAGEAGDGSAQADRDVYRDRAMGMMVRGNFQFEGNAANPNYTYDGETDSDAYQAIFGGDDKKGMNNRCYIQDFQEGISYELLTGFTAPAISCPGGTIPLCGNSESGFIPGVINSVSGGGGTNGNSSNVSGGGGNTFSDSDECVYTGETPFCVNGGGAQCASGGDALCAPGVGGGNMISTTASCESFANPGCAGGAAGAGGCNHLFPTLSNVGNGSFNIGEESTWLTDPDDEDTADNGMNDEATLAGLSQDKLTWTYQPGDLVSVFVEGTSMAPTRYADGSNMIMWAYPNNDCDVTNKSVKNEYIKGYAVDIPIAGLMAGFDVDGDISACVADNWVDPSDAGLSTGLEISLDYVPEDPINDYSTDYMGDIVVASASVSNSSVNETNMLYKWKIEISNDGSFTPAFWNDITSYVGIDKIEGNGLSSIEFELGLNSPDPDNPLVQRFYGASNAIRNANYGNAFPDGLGRIKISVEAQENADSTGKHRIGYTEVILKVISTQEKITAWKIVNSGIVGAPDLDFIDSDPILPGMNPICNTTPEDRTICQVIKNEIIGMSISTDTDPNWDSDNDGDSTNDVDLENFNWIINGKPLICDTSISSGPAQPCSDSKQTEYNFFVVDGDPGESYTVMVTANSVWRTVFDPLAGTKTVGGQKVNIIRRFEVIDPYIKILSDDGNASSWPKLLGSYEGFDQVFYPDYSESVFQTFANTSPVNLKAEFHPSWIQSDCKAEWLVDGFDQNDAPAAYAMASADSNGDAVDDLLSFDASKLGGDAFNIAFNANYNKDNNAAGAKTYRRAMQEIWGISQFESPDLYIATPFQIEVIAENVSTQTGPKKFFASIVSNLPGQIMFLLRLFLTVFVIIFTAGIVFSLTPGILPKQ